MNIQKKFSLTNHLIRVLLGCCVLFLISLCAYSNSFVGKFVFDDIYDIVLNPIITERHSLIDIIRHFPSRWLVYATFRFNYVLSGFDTMSYHVVNFMLHLCNALLLWRFLHVLFDARSARTSASPKKNIPLAFMCACIFAVHPLQTQAVSYIVQRLTLMGAFFYLLALCAYVSARASSQKKYYIICAGALLGGMVSKETIYSFVILVPAIEILIFDNRVVRSFVRRWWKITFFCGLVLLAVYFFAFDPHAFFKRFSLSDQPTHTSLQYFLTQFRVVALYARLLFVPLGLNADYHVPVSTTLFDLRVIAGIIAYGALVFCAFSLYKKKDRLLSLAIVWFLTTLLIESSIIPLREIASEHRLYLPLVSFAIIFTVLLARIIKKRKIVFVIFSCVVIAFIGMTYQRNRVWQDPLIFWEDVMVKSPAKARAYINHGMILSQRDEHERAFTEYQAALERDPDHTAAHFNIAKTYAIFDRPRLALEHYQKALTGAREATIIKMIYLNRGMLFAELGQNKEARDAFTRAIEKDAAFKDAYFQRAFTFLESGNTEEAFNDFETARALGYEQKEADLKKMRVYFPELRSDPTQSTD
jgi:protein O-mannosyl-transferase